MLPLFIVEDNLKQKSEMERIITNYIDNEELDIGIVCSTANPYECIKYLKNHPKKKGLYFLDVNLKGEIDGFKLGQQIRELDPNGRIVFVTVEGALAYLTFLYKVEALDYIIKGSGDDVANKIRSSIKVAYQRYISNGSMEREQIDIVVGKSIRSYPFEEVLYIETSDKEGRLVLHTISSREEFKGLMKDVELANPKLIRCHKSYLVNTENVKEFDEGQMLLTMSNGHTVLVAARKKLIVRKMWQKKSINKTKERL